MVRINLIFTNTRNYYIILHILIKENSNYVFDNLFYLYL